MTTEMLEMDEFDVLLNDVLRTVANPEIAGAGARERADAGVGAGDEE